MSYVNYDHAGWVQSEMDAYKRNRRKAGKNKFSTPIGLSSGPEKLSRAHAVAFDILGMVGGGIYNCPISWDTVEFIGDYGVCVSWRNSMATFDFNNLTRFVFLCHAARMRGGISPSGPGLLRIILTQRVEAGEVSARHPSLPEAVAEFEKYLPADHRIAYGVTDEFAVAA